MKTIKKAALIGAGAIGGFFVAGIEDSEETLTVIAEGERAQRLRSNGVKVNGKVYHPTVMTAEEAGEQDLIIIATKYLALDEAIEYTKKMLGAETLILSTLNGVDSEERVASAVGREHVLHSIMRIASRRVGNRIEIQEADNLGVLFGNAWIEGEKGREAVAAVADFFDRTKVVYNLPEDILYAQWQKFASNVAYNLPMAMVGCGNGIYEDSEHGHFLSQALWKEAAALAKTYGVELPESVKPWKVAKSSRFSTLQDLDAKRPTEIEMFAGVLVRKSEEAGLKAPFAECVYHTIRLLEEKNAGRFDYED